MMRGGWDGSSWLMRRTRRRYHLSVYSVSGQRIRSSLCVCRLTLSTSGADPLLAMPSVEELAPALGKRHAPIKAVLLDQNGPLCGIGNWMVDEILYQSALVSLGKRASLAKVCAEADKYLCSHSILLIHHRR